MRISRWTVWQAILLFIIVDCRLSRALGEERRVYETLRRPTQHRQIVGTYPTSLMSASDRMLYGTTESGGAHGFGTLFRVGDDGLNYATLHSFGSVTNDGLVPRSAPVEIPDGRLLGTTTRGGVDQAGTLYSLRRDGSGYRQLVDFATAGLPLVDPGQLLLGSDGNLYGTCLGGSGVFKYVPREDRIELVHQFGVEPGDSGVPHRQLVETGDGWILGALLEADHGGWLFKFRLGGADYRRVYRFEIGHFPNPPSVTGTDRKLYGLTPGGRFYSFDPADDRVEWIRNLFGAGGLSPGFSSLGPGPEGSFCFGTADQVARISMDGQDLRVLHHFSSEVDGASIDVPPVLSADGKLVGIARVGGAAFGGALFSVNADGSQFATPFSFGTVDALGLLPMGRLLPVEDGWIIGTTFYGGGGNQGTVFRMSASGGAYEVLHSFNQARGDGALPSTGLIRGRDGFLYGTTSFGGPDSGGTLFRVHPSGDGFEVLSRDLRGSLVELVQDPSGTLYGYGIRSQRLFAIRPDGTGYRELGPEVWLVNDLLLGSDGLLYAATGAWGENGAGFIFSIETDGSGFKELAHMPGNASAPCFIIEGVDGDLYGTSAGASPGADGIVFRVPRSGSGMTVLHSFGGNPTDGRFPGGGLLQRKDGSLWGATEQGGLDGIGTVFAIRPDGTGYRTIRSFQAGAGDIAGSRGRLVDAPDGVFGTAFGADRPGFPIPGMIFRLDPALSPTGAYLTEIRQQPTGVGVVLRGTCLARGEVRIESSPSLEPGSWVIAARVVADDAGNLEHSVQASDDGARFWRVILEASPARNSNKDPGWPDGRGAF